MSESTTTDVKSTESVNTNEVTADAAQPIEVTGGDSAISFDELEKLHDQDKALKKEAKKEAKEPKEEVKAKDKDETDEKKDSKEEKPKETKGKEKELSKSKAYKVKSGDTEIDLLADSKVVVNVDGKPQEVTYQELLNNFSGKVAYDKKFSELDTQRKSFERERGIMQRTMDHFYDMAVNNKKPMDAINFLGDVLGADMSKFWEDFENEMLPKIEELAKLPEHERKLKRTESQLERYRKKEELDRSQAQKQREMTELETQVKQLQQKLGVDDKVFLETYEELQAAGKLDKLAEDNPNKSMPELVADYYVDKQTTQGMAKLLTEVAPDLGSEGVKVAIKDLKDLMKVHGQLSETDLRDIIVEVYGGKAAKNLNRKINKSKPVNTARMQSRSPEDAWSFDQID